MSAVTDAMVEAAARNILRSDGITWIETDTEWDADVARYREMCVKFPDYARTVRSQIADAFRHANAALAAGRQTPSSLSSLPERGEAVDCPCTFIEQDETCPKGYPSLLCGVCGGKGHASQEDVSALAAEMLNIANELGEPEDPFAAWETLSLITSENERLNRLIAASPVPDQGEVERLRKALLPISEDRITGIAIRVYQGRNDDGHSISWGNPRNSKTRAQLRSLVREVLNAALEGK